MTDRGRSPVDASFACPFVAYEDDRDARSDAPDPRHRCFAELRPAPRAIAHQQAYCLSSGFATCPTFVDWAQREAARVRTAERPSRHGAGLAAASAFEGGVAGAEGETAEAGRGRHAPEDLPAAEPVWPRRSEREWASPPPWGGEHADAPEDLEPEPEVEEEEEEEEAAAPPPFLGDRELPGRSRDRGLDRGGRADGGSGRAAAGAAGFAAGAAGPADGAGYAPDRGSRRMRLEDETEGEAEPEEPPMRRFSTDARRSGRRPVERGRGAGLAGGPSWETPHRYEAYPTLRAPRSVRNLSPLLLAVVVLVIAALVLFFVPPLILNLGSGPGSTPTPSPSATTGASSPSTAASSSPAASSGTTTYTVKSGDTMSKIAARYGVTLDQLIAANKNTIKDPNKLAIGDTLVIPTPVPSEIVGVSPSPS